MVQDPLLYDRLIRRFQDAVEREAEGRRKGYSGTLEADVQRSEARINALADANASGVTFNYKQGPNSDSLTGEAGEVATDKDQGFQMWRWEMEARFIRGEDVDFDYDAVDATDEFDDQRLEEREAQEKWFEEEDATFVTGDDGNAIIAENELQGETGVQDF